MDSTTNHFQWRQAALDQVGRLAAVPTDPASTPPLFLGEFGEIPVEVDHDLANLVLPAYCLSEPGETPGSAFPANRSQ
jgi:hypothetical protein